MRFMIMAVWLHFVRRATTFQRVDRSCSFMAQSIATPGQEPRKDFLAPIPIAPEPEVQKFINSHKHPKGRLQ